MKLRGKHSTITEAEKETMRQLYAEGFRVYEIAEKVNRSRPAVCKAVKVTSDDAFFNSSVYFNSIRTI